MSGFYFNGQAIGDDRGYLDGQESSGEYSEEDGEEYESEEDSDDYDPSQYGQGNLASLPRMGSADAAHSNNNAQPSVEDLDRMLTRPPPKLSHFVAESLPSLNEELRRLKNDQYKVPKPSRAEATRQRSPQQSEFDTALLNEAFAYVKKLTGSVNTEALRTGGAAGQGAGKRGKKKKKNGGAKKGGYGGVAQGSALRAARANSGRSRGKGQGAKGPRKLNTRYGKGKSRVNGKLGVKKSINQRVKQRLHDEAFKKSGSKGPSVEMQKLIEQFETGSVLSNLRSQLEKSKQSKSNSESFIQAARREWLH